MRLLIINNDTKHLEELLELCHNNTHEVFMADRLGGVNPSDYDALILSGSYNHSVTYELNYYRQEIELLGTSNLPVLGICLGFELIATAFGCELRRMEAPAKGSRTITPTTAGRQVFGGSDAIHVAEAHRWSVPTLPFELESLATSSTGIEALRHRTKPIYGLQFHPEDKTYSDAGKQVFENILELFRCEKVSS